MLLTAPFDLSLDPADPVPLYHQIVQAIRWRIGTGSLAPGDRLPPLREAAAAWDVHLHTVRRAYRALADAGFVDARPGAGTRVLPGSTEAAGDVQARSGWRAAERARLRGSPADPTSGPTLVECNRHQCVELGRQIGEYFGLPVREWLLDEGPPPPGLLIGTRFHEAEMRRAWPDRADDMCFVSLRVDPAVGPAIESRRDLGLNGELVLCERDASTARQMARDIAEHMDAAATRIRCTTRDPARTLESLSDTAVLLVAPRRWGEVPAAARLDPRVIEACHGIEPAELERLRSKL